MYRVKEIFYTLQGEGSHAGRPSVFCRFTSCNLWTGLEKDRQRAICKFCDTDFVGTDGSGGGRFRSPDELASAVAKAWPGRDDTHSRRYVVCTGGEPLLQLDDDAVDALRDKGFEVAIETNGTRPAPKRVDWICVSPKAGAELVLRSGNDLKLVYPQAGAEPELFEHLSFDRFLLQPMDGEHLVANVKAAIEYCLEHPQWHLSIQTHKILGIR
ncbi:7-carboxy-7-deazaguanine synthase [Nonomuraea sp. NPDC049758]|uniref:7-carboxy-7-deazaguanine synthase n=1 Tax=Nonomuraea sp. NPDC049758 TaxID=3154360 RepID=UPI00343FD9B7